ncbi:alanine racemase [Novosphingobium sp.]|uniref:alanine racemase n=1 Tax=Novosphingobium sp. TaxID=1874826 RepID=UPI0035B15FC4
MPIEQPNPALRLAIDGAALADNWRALDRLSGTAAAGAAVKADAYGLGARACVPVLRDAGCRDFFVAHMAEAVVVAEHVPADQIAVLHGPHDTADAAFARVLGVRPVINSLGQARLWIEAGGGTCDLMVDTGMNRLGVALAELGDPILDGLQVDTLLSHLACAEEAVPLNERQRLRWDEARRAVPHRRASLANSAGIMLGAGYHGDLTRPGLALYGGVPCAALEGVNRQVVRPEALVIQVRDVPAGETIGYNATYTAPAPLRIGVISLGYADGYLRCWSGKGAMLHGDRRLPVLGRVSMDMTMIDLTEAPDVGEGDWVAADYALPQAAAISGLSQYELLTILGRRFGR